MAKKSLLENSIFTYKNFGFRGKIKKLYDLIITIIF